MFLKQENKIWVAKSGVPVYMYPKMSTRHGLIAGATGTGKTITSKVLAEAFSDMGVPVFMADIKGDVSGLGMQGEINEKIASRIEKLGVTGFSPAAYPVRFFDVYGKKGIPARATISEMGPDLLARLLELNDVQSGVLSIVFRVADDKGLLLLDLKDLRAMVQYVGDHAGEYTTRYGNIASQSIGAVQRSLLRLEDQGGEVFFGEPALNVMDWISLDSSGRGYINILHCVELFQAPLLYSTFMLWMLSEIYENLPEVGDLDKPKMVFFFDEAHLIFNDAPKALVQKIEQVVKLVRSKGVGIYFITQVPSDIPDSVLSQLGNKVQHALRAFTPNELKAVKAAAQSFRENPAIDTENALGELGTGEGLVSFLGEDGIPGIVERAMILPPQSMIGAMDDQTRVYMNSTSDLYAKYYREVDRESAYELLAAAAGGRDLVQEPEQQRTMTQEEIDARIEAKAKELAKEYADEKEEKTRTKSKKTYSNKSTIERTIDSALTTVGREVGRQLIRGLLGNLRR